jgi:tRNA pseudouridine55 synthase
MKSTHGVLAINKPKHMTSFDVCHHIKRITKSKVGHTGTLDPDATGVLLVCVGGTTKYVPFLMGQSKIYQSTLILGTHTHSLDTSGEVLETKPIQSHSEEGWQDLVHSMIETHHLAVPQVSAIKVDGKRLYAQKDFDLDLLPIKEMIVYDAHLMSLSDTSVTTQMHVNTGSYIRTLNVELARRSSNIGTTQDIIRIQNGPITLDLCQDLPQSLEDCVFLDAKKLFSSYPCIELDDITPIIHGKIISFESDEPLLCVIRDELPFAMLEKTDLGYKVKRGLWYEDASY